MSLRTIAKALPCLLSCLLLLGGTVFAQETIGGKSYKYIWNLATIVPKGIGWGTQYEKIIVPAMEESFRGEVGLKIFWGGIQGDDPEVVTKLKEGKLEGAGFDGRGTVAACKAFGVLTMPFLFRDFEEVDHIRDTMWPEFDKLMGKSGLALCLWLDQDFDQVYSSKAPLSTPESFAGVRTANWNGEVEKKVLEALGAVPVPVAVKDIAGVVNRGEATAVLCPAIWVVGTQLYSTFRFINPMHLRYCPATVVVTSKAWDVLPQEYRDTYLGKRAEVEKAMNATIRRDNLKCLAGMKRYGVKVVEPTAEELAAFVAKTKPVYDAETGKLFPRELLDTIQQKLADYRKTKQQ
ncbi:MAG: TRAP transporter substrate-binding protein DctP [Thermodesulfobacteriota bacterium]